MKTHKLAAFHVRFIEIPVLESRVVSQQCNGTQYTSPNIEMQTNKPLSQSINQQSFKDKLLEDRKAAKSNNK